MADPIVIEVIGYSDQDCGPFPCEPDRTCGLEECFPSGSLLKAIEALRHALGARYGDRVTLSVTLLDDGVPDRVQVIIERSHPPVPMVLLNGRVTPIGRIALPKIVAEIEKAIAGSQG